MAEMMFRGLQGPKGDKGDKGEGISPAVRRALVFLLALTLTLAAFSLLFTAHYVNSTASANQNADAAARKAVAAVAAADAAKAAQGALCASVNTSRADQVSLWNFVIRLSGPPQTAQQRRVLAEFERHLRVALAPQHCALPDPSAERKPS